MKKQCFTCVHFDVVNFECPFLAEKFKLDREAVPVDMNWSCADHTEMSDLSFDDLKIDITVKL